jgi:hypothetical protein
VKRAAIWLAAILLVILFLFLLARRNARPPDRDTAAQAGTALYSSTGGISVVENSSLPSGNPSSRAPQLLGETILRDYASSAQPPQNDLTLMARLMENSLLLLKSAGNRPLSANEDWADLFRGKNAAHERFLPDNHIALNAQGQLVDRWGTPLFFHALGGRRFEIRSAGPDRKLWTSDDIHRNSDGTFRRGAELNPSALY